jgi:hypothetical protein
VGDAGLALVVVWARGGGLDSLAARAGVAPAPKSPLASQAGFSRHLRSRHAADRGV